jgi:hypothetical protein
MIPNVETKSKALSQPLSFGTEAMCQPSNNYCKFALSLSALLISLSYQ